MLRTPGGDSARNLRIAGIAALVAILGYLARNDEIDDALIYARYVANALHGLGLVFNANEHINALTSPLYSYLVLGLSAMLRGHVLGATAIVSGVFLFGVCVLAEWLVAYAGLLLASTGYFYTLVGMESSVFLFMLLAVVLLMVTEHYEWVPLVAMLLLLTRFEGGALVAAVAVEMFRKRRWPSLRSLWPAAGLAVVYLLLNHFWYGAFLPASAGAKLGQGRSEYWGRWPFAFFKTAYQLKGEFLSTVYVVVLVAVLVIPGVVAIGRSRRSVVNRLVLPFLGMLLGFYMVFNLPGYKWYHAPFLCFAMLYACAALPGIKGMRWVIVPVILLSAMTAGRRFAVQNSAPAAGGYPMISEWLDHTTPKGVRVEAGEIGTLGWTCQRCYLMDILGLTFPKNAEHIARRDSTSWLGEDRPDYIVVHYQPWVFEDVAKSSLDYERVPVDFGDVVYLLHRRDEAAR